MKNSEIISKNCGSDVTYMQMQIENIVDSNKPDIFKYFAIMKECWRFGETIWQVYKNKGHFGK